MSGVLRWFFSPPAPPVTPWKAWVWWELRRVPFNLVIGVYGVACLIVFCKAIAATGYLEPGEDAVEPVALLLALIVINALYTLGWWAEVPVRVFVRQDLDAGPVLLKLGLCLGLALITLPAAFWSGFRLLQLGGIVQ